jgi:type IX secretion system substrate protein
MKNQLLQNRHARNKMKFHENFIHRSQSLILLAILLFSFSVNNSYGQPCLTNSLTINTGYDPVLGIPITPGGNACPAVTDPKWMVTAISSPGVYNAITATTACCSLWYDCPTGTVVEATANADVINAITGGGWVTNPSSNYISCINASWFNTDGTGPSPAGTQYAMTLSRSFTMCVCDSLVFDLQISNDNWISDVDIDGGPILFSQPVSIGNYLAFVPFTYRIALSAGTHVLNVVVNNWNDNIPLNQNGLGLNVVGTISSASGSNSLVSESNTACLGYSCPPEPVIAGPSTICMDTPVILSTTVPGRWGTYSPNVALMPSGLLCNVSGISPGTAVIYYATGAYGCDTLTDTVTVIGEPNVCVTMECCPVYVLNFTSSSPTAVVTYEIMNAAGGVLCPGPFYAPVTAPLPFTTVAGLCVGADGICITGVSDHGCSWTIPRLPSGGGCCAYANPAHKFAASVSQATTEIGKISLIPDPNNGTFTVFGNLSAMPKSSAINIEVIDISGSVIYKNIVQSTNGDINQNITLDSNIPNGTYTVKIYSGDASQTLRFILSK